MKLLGQILVALATVIPAHGQTASSTSSREPTATVSESGLTATLTSAASTSSSSSSSSSSQEGCPTVTLTSNICHSCATPDCVELEPLTNSCDCPSAIPTVFVDYPCESGCGGIGCAANYVFFTANCTSETTTESSGSSGATASNSTASATGTGAGAGGLNSTTSGVTTTGTSTRSGGSSTGTGTAAESSSSIAAAGRTRPFWMGLM